MLEELVEEFQLSLELELVFDELDEESQLSLEFELELLLDEEFQLLLELEWVLELFSDFFEGTTSGLFEFFFQQCHGGMSANFMREFYHILSSWWDLLSFVVVGRLDCFIQLL